MPTTPDTTTTNLASLIVLLQKLYEQLTTDRQHWANTGQDMAALIESLDKQLQTFQTLQLELKMQVTTVIKETSQHAAQTVALSVQQTVTQKIDAELSSLLQPLASAVDEAAHQLKKQKQTLQSYQWWMIASIFFSSCLGGLMVRYGLQPEFSDYERQLMHQGSVLAIARQAQSQDERDQILAPYLGQRLTSPQPEPSKKIKAVPKNEANRLHD